MILDQKVTYFRGTRDIEVGEEVCTYYGENQYWDDRSHTKKI